MHLSLSMTKWIDSSMFRHLQNTYTHTCRLFILDYDSICKNNNATLHTAGIVQEWLDEYWEHIIILLCLQIIRTLSLSSIYRNAFIRLSAPWILHLYPTAAVNRTTVIMAAYPCEHFPSCTGWLFWLLTDGHINVIRLYINNPKI